jgi:ABC-type cobalamin/Fe3+-siderophores transport system ATPase subunit
MRIISIEQSSAPFNDGLADIKMRGLNRIVILAGANGSGKTRLLRRIQQASYLNSNQAFWRNGYEFESLHGLEAINFVPKTI